MVDAEEPPVECVSAPELAKLFDVTEQTIRDYVAQGLVVRIGRGRYDKNASTTLTMRHLREAASGRGGSEQVQDLTKERARLASEQADREAMKNGLLRGQLLDAAEVERVWADHIRKARSAILAVPSRIRQLLGHIGDMETRVIDRELREALAVLGHGQVPVGPEDQEAA